MNTIAASPHRNPARGTASTALAASFTLTVLAAWSLWTLAAPAPLGNFSDSVDYLILAEFYRGHLGGGVVPAVVDHYAHSRFPPLFALALAAVDATPENHLRGLVLTQSFAFVAAALFAAWYLREGVGTRAAALLCAVAFATTAPLYLLLNVVSEPMLLALLALALLLSRRRTDDLGSLMLLALVIGLAPMARMAAVALVAAFGVWLLRQERMPVVHRATCLATAAAPALVWLGYRSLLPVEESYVAALEPGRILAAFGGWTGLLARPLALWSGLAAAFHPGAGVAAHAASGAVLMLACVALPSRWRARSLDGVFAPLYLGLVLVWPYPAEVTRLMLAVLPVLVLQAWVAAGELNLRLGAVRAMPLALGAALLVATTSGWQFTLHRIRLPIDAELAAQARSPAYFLADGDANAFDGVEREARLVALSRELPAVVAADDCVYSLFPAIAWVQSGGKVRMKAIPNEVIAGHLPVERLRDCRYLLVANLHASQHDRPPLFPLDEVRAWMRPVMASSYRRNGESVLAAALMEWVSDPADEQSP